ncbi:hypothetical protein [Fibrella arboris]|uniref:hypothetical protein n=1 Tax=Fibrella arboris TaxID=3242486 RepID=UPI00351F933D
MMNVLILGGAQACGPGLPNGKSYLDQFARRLRSFRHPIQLDHRPVSLEEAVKLLPRLPLSDYDLILLQFDFSMEWIPAKPLDRLLLHGLIRLKGHQFSRLKLLREQLVKVLLQVRVYNRQVVLMTPLPHRRGLERSLLQLAQAIYLQESREWQVTLFDVGQHLVGGDELFQDDSANRLSAVAHELLGSELHTFITEPTYTIWS